MVTALWYGNSVSDSQMDPNVYGGGRWGDGACNALGWTRVGKGISAGDNSRGAIGGSSMQIIPANPTHLYGSTGVTSRIVPYTPNKLVFEYGANDFFYAEDSWNPTTYAAAWDTMMVAVRAMAVQPDQLIVVGMTPMAAQGQESVKKPPFSWAQDFEAIWKGLEDVNKSKADQYGATYVDMTGMPVYWMGIPYGWDGVHPKSLYAQGYYTSQFVKAITPVKYWGCGGHI